MKNIDEIINKLYRFYNVSTISDLADKLNMSQPAVSNWSKRNSITAIQKKCRELNIYDEIFAESENLILELAKSITSDKETEERIQQILMKFKISSDAANESKEPSKTQKLIEILVDFTLNKPKFSQTLTLLSKVLNDIDTADLSVANAKGKLKKAVEDYVIKLKDQFDYMATENLKRELVELIEKLEDSEAIIILLDKDKTAQKIKENVNIFHKFIV